MVTCDIMCSCCGEVSFKIVSYLRRFPSSSVNSQCLILALFLFPSIHSGAKCGGGLGECHDDDHAAEEAAEAVVIGEEVHDDEGDGDEHSSHDEEESSSHDMSDSPSSATIRGVVAALAIAIAGGSMILA